MAKKIEVTVTLDESSIQAGVDCIKATYTCGDLQILGNRIYMILDSYDRELRLQIDQNNKGWDFSSAGQLTPSTSPNPANDPIGTPSIDGTSGKNKILFKIRVKKNTAPAPIKYTYDHSYRVTNGKITLTVDPFIEIDD
jgi:hypothetical protein